MPRAATRKQKLPPPARVEEYAPILCVDVDWAKLPMPEAQNYYAHLREYFEQAGKILNARLMHESQTEFYECFMAGREKCCAKGTKHRMPARGTDYENGHKDLRTGLVTPVLICSENCWIRYQAALIEERRERNLVPRNS